ncbi:hypothetical protein [Prosthecomicrobium hirschii]|uniref:hypothetical protein n=1 Tax=Prosthecodimorpha hirschii TaxID=665126 RepID=UPI00222027CE|nr:hypothetical protein [Prosthecomicrobium hirschii]MCW1839178.1 hypothetical protein [Prosthecomicrobium hirschii]
MGKTLFIHIGMPKAGSTTLQFALRSHRDLLAAAGVYYLRLGECHNEIFRTFCGAPHPRSDIPATTAIELQGLKRTAAAYGGRIVEEARKVEDVGIVSGEALISFTREQVEMIRDVFRPHFDRIAIVAYLREPLSWASSRTQQKIKNGADTLERIIASIDQEQSPLVPPYRAIRIWEDVFGRDALILRPFAREAFPNGDLIADFFAAIGRPELAEPLPRQDKNLTLSQEAVQLVDALKRLDEARNGKQSPASRRLRYALMRLPGERFSLPRATLERVQARAEPEIAWLKEKYGVDVQPRGPRYPDAPVAWQSDTVDALVERLERAVGETRRASGPLSRLWGWMRARLPRSLRRAAGSRSKPGPTPISDD